MSRYCRAKAICLFFFQAEDGIRDVAVTGVQTCALPISAATLSAALAIVVPAPKRAPAHVGTLSNKISAAGISWYAGTLRNIRAGRRNNQKNLWLITLAASSAASPVGSLDRKSTRLNSSHGYMSYAVFC